MVCDRKKELEKKNHAEGGENPGHLHVYNHD